MALHCAFPLKALGLYGFGVQALGFRGGLGIRGLGFQGFRGLSRL